MSVNLPMTGQTQAIAELRQSSSYAQQGQPGR